jgi:hypothetical protein
MKPLAPLSDDVLDNDQARRAAAREGLFFHIDKWNDIIEHRGCDSEKRPATEPELQMWRKLVGTIEPGRALDADVREFVSSFTGGGPYYICADDFAVLRRDPAFDPEMAREKLLSGFFGTYKKASIYISRSIPKGYYLDPGRVVPELNWHPSVAATRELAPELDEYLRCELESEHLKPLLARS